MLDKILWNPLEKSIQEGKRRLCKQTNWVHAEDGKTIPLFDNGCFILALFRMGSETVKEGLERLDRLLAFQSSCGGFAKTLDGSFFVQSRQVSLYLLVIFLFLRDHFACFFASKERRKRFEKAIEQLAQFCQTSHSHRPFSRGALSLFQAVYRSLDPTKEDSGSSLDFSSFSSSDWSDYLLARELLGETAPLCPSALEVWDFSTSSYVGSPHWEFQKKNHPKPTFFHLFMASQTSRVPSYLQTPQPIQIAGSLIFRLSPSSPPDLPTKGALIACTTFPKSTELPHHHGFHLMRFLWGDLDRTFSIVCQDLHHTVRMDAPNIFSITYPLDTTQVQRGGVELSFFVDRTTKILLNGDTATCFFLTDRLEIITPNHRVRLAFSIVEGQGKLCGHLRQGNRPCQIERDSLVAYDWRLDLRTLERTPSFTVQVACISENSS